MKGARFVCLLTYTVNVSAGLMNSTTGTVVKVIYDNTDVQDLLDGQHHPAYCITVNFPQFCGFIVNGKNSFHLQILTLFHCTGKSSCHKHCLPRLEKAVFVKLLPRKISHRPLSSYHLAPGARSNAEESAGLESPSNHIPPDIGSVIYVACTRTNILQTLFVHPVFPTIWKNIGKSEQDKARWGVKKKCAEDFERLHGWLVEF